MMQARHCETQPLEVLPSGSVPTTHQSPKTQARRQPAARVSVSGPANQSDSPRTLIYLAQNITGRPSNTSLRVELACAPLEEFFKSFYPSPSVMSSVWN